ncbi:hypothetical protein Cgig2_012253 [Carnegiea gigantea]|uniref:Uncharacterized protein n=1 Tax=Carnegiea gigantea TaxID=171969 RepID=A0A9Q1Q4C5_9CARY|nr:hypothetical protein Cgig2_012253 [Carnegiea gigantea]
MKDEWLRAAVFDDALVADLLLRLRDFSSGSHSDSPQPPVILRPIKALPPKWGLRQPRSKSQSPEKKEAPRSPTSPLSWVGGGEGCEESSTQPPPSDRFRSKVHISSTSLSYLGYRFLNWPECPSTVSVVTIFALPNSGFDYVDLSFESPKYPLPSHWIFFSDGRTACNFRRVRTDWWRWSRVDATHHSATHATDEPPQSHTFGELKEEEGSLLKEQTYLKKKLEKLRLRLKERRSMNEKLKRMKLDLHVESVVKSDANRHEPDRQNMIHNCASSEATSSSMSRPVKCEYNSEPDSCQEQKVAKSLDAVFVLPDLNMIPDEDSVQEVGMS